MKYIFIRIKNVNRYRFMTTVCLIVKYIFRRGLKDILQVAYLKA